MRPARQLIAVALLAYPAQAILGQEVAVGHGEPVDYVRDVKPVLEARCYACHGPLKVEQGLRLDTAAAIRQGGDSGPAIEAHAPGESLLISAISGSDGWRMPPEGEPLSATEIERISRWVEAGAAGPEDEEPAADPSEHWAFLPPQRAELPKVADEDWADHPVDRFVAAQRDVTGVAPVPLADKATLLRRLYIDLIGLPPTADELAEFLADESPGAYETVVDRLLASPQYGERWARHWMDVWRYSDWYGYGAEVRNSQPHIWRWRDWIIDSLNADRGYDRMIVEMLAGDEVAPTDPQALAATGYLVRNWYKFNRNTWLDDTVEHTGKAFLGLTFNCARCHDHKYDPISQESFYRLRAYFEAHDVRTDAVSGVRDRSKDGLVRAYDAHLDRSTHLFERGDEKHPDTSRALAAGLPPVLSPSELVIEPITLPSAAWYPSSDADIRQSVLNEALERLQQAQAALAAIETAEPEAAAAEAPEADATESDAAPTIAQLERGVAEKGVSAALANLLAVRAKLGADDAKLADPPDPLADALALSAGFAERQAAVAAAERTLAEAQWNLVKAEQAETSEDGQGEDEKNTDEKKVEEKNKQIAAAQAKVDEATAALTTAQTAAADTQPSYTPFEPVYPQTSSGRRLALAQWIASANNPLTARVAVNHLWRRHFGKPLVATMFDFGMNGQRPTHPELLDWLAVELMEQNWSLKHVHRLLVTSRLYRLQSSSATETSVDPDNRLWWRMNVRRMDAEVVRDALLHLSGGLDNTQGGPEIDHTTADSTARRSIYYRHANEKRVTFLELFDQPGVSEAYDRLESIVPQQALALLNSGFALERSQALATLLWDRAESLGDEAQVDERFVRLAFQQIISRDPQPAEADACQSYLQAADASSEAAAARRASLVHVLFNHNDFVSVR